MCRVFRRLSFTTRMKFLVKPRAVMTCESRCATSVTVSDFHPGASTVGREQLSSTPVPIVPVLDESQNPELNIKAIREEMERFKLRGLPVPSQMTDVQLADALRRESRSQRLKFYKYLLGKELRRSRKINRKLVNVNESAESVAVDEPTTVSHENCDLYRVPYLLIDRKKMNMTYVQWYFEAIRFDCPHLVIDLDFDSEMIERESSNCAQQIMNVYDCNRKDRHPFNLHLCNARDKEPTVGYLRRFISDFNSPTCLMTVNEVSYLDLFPKEKIVYLTPHCEDELINYDPEAIYVIGGIVSTRYHKPLTFQKATSEQLKMAKLPLDKYLSFGSGHSKSLTIDQVVKIMLDLKATKSDFNVSLKHVPNRKLKW